MKEKKGKKFDDNASSERSKQLKVIFTLFTLKIGQKFQVKKG